ncbi:MAG: alkaline phosphatase D family protein [Phycisphaerae bacterium]|nr:alkaline phosphatase D family protein [Phycisphaerae bacterium]
MTIHRRQFLKATIGLSTIALLKPELIFAGEKPLHQRLGKGDINTSLEILNMWGTQPQEIQDWYKVSHKFLATDLQSSYAELAKTETFIDLAKKLKLTHIGGPILGDITTNSVKIWVRTLKPAKVMAKLTIDNKTITEAFSQTTTESDLACVIQVKNLKPYTCYHYQIFIDDKPANIPIDAVITTAPDQNASDKTRIAFGTCYHRWGIGNSKQAELIASRKPHALLLGGDVAVQDRRNHIGLHRADFLLRDLAPAWQKLVASVPVYTTWDDHDYFDNDLAGIPKGYKLKDKQNVWKAFTQAWPNPAFGFGQGKQGVHFRSRIGCCDVIMLDTRYFRENKAGSFLGDEQMAWLKTQLLDCTGPFIILSSGTMFSDYVSKGKDSWGKWDPAGRETIFKFIEDNQIPGVLLTSGDRHGARGFAIPRPSGYNFYEFEVAALGGRSGPPATDPSWKTQFYSLSGEFAFGEFTFDTTKADPTVTFNLIHEDGKILHTKTLTKKMLTPSKK